MQEQECTHLDQVHDVKPRTPQGCEECLKTGSWWVHLRLCLACGHVGCCDQSPNRHATAHFHEVGHPLIQSYEPSKYWAPSTSPELRLLFRWRPRLPLEVES